MSDKNTLNMQWCGSALLVTLMGLYSACIQKQQQEAATIDDEFSLDASPALAAAGDDQVTLFGEISGVPTYDFESRTAVSLRQHSYPPEGSDFDPATSRDGRMMIFASTRHSLNPDIYYQEGDGLAVVQLTSDPASDVQPAFSPDGRRVAFASDRAGNWDIWIINLDGQQPVQVTTGMAHEVHPSWSPDGAQLVFSSMAERGGQWELWLASAEAGAVKKFIGYGLFPEWAPNDDTILFQRARRRGSRWFSLWTLKLINGEPRLPTEVASSAEHAMILPTWSPDQKQIAYCTVESVPSIIQGTRNPLQQADIWMVDADGRSRVRLTDGVSANYAPSWSKSGRIYFTSDRAGDGENESVWSVIPLRAPLASEQRPGNNVFGRSEVQRADEVMNKNPGERRTETAGFPGHE